jgi:hypothetical protein
MATEPETHESHEEHLCDECWRKRCAVDVLESAIWNALSAGLDPEDIYEIALEIIEPDPPGQITEQTETVGEA